MLRARPEREHATINGVPDLTSSQRKRLRSLAHDLRPIVHVGAAGLTDGVLRSVNAALDDHELIKVRFLDHTDRKKELSTQIANRLHGHVAGLIGHVAILYRPARDPEARRIELPAP